MKIILTTLLLGALLSTATDISMLGLKIGDSKSSLEKIKLKVVAKENDIIKYRTENGNDFSVTTENEKIVYMENDWLQDKKASQALFSDFQFGQTTLRDIRKKFGTNGFTYQGMGSMKTETAVIAFNCFEFDSPNGEILVTITKVPLTANVSEANIADNLKLDAIIIAKQSYCDDLWGNEKLYDKNYKKIKL